jgi:4-amino-4-deoxy-L-arabinose transferase-like glycosyltransferase
MSKILNSKFYILFIILIIAAFLRLYNITEVPAGLYPDEAMNGNNALEALSTGDFKIFYPENNGREGLFMNIQAIFLAIFGNQPWALRLPSALFGILTVLGIYFLTKELFKDRGVALLSSFLLATSFWHINFSRIGFRAIMAPFFAVWAIYFLLKALNARKYILNSVLGGILFGLGFYSYIAFRALPLLILIILFIYWLKNKEKMTRKKVLLVACLFTLVALIVFAPLGYYFLKNPQDFLGRTTQISIFNSPTPLKDLGLNISKTAGMFNFSGDWNWRHNYAGRPELFWPVGILFIIGILLGFYFLLKKKLPFIILFAWLIIAGLPVVVSNEGMPHALRTILMIPPVFILASFGGIWLYEFIKSRIESNLRFMFHVSCFIILSLLVFEAYTTYFVKWARNSNTFDAFSADYVWLAKGLNDLPKETPKYVVVEASGIEVRGIPMPAQTVMFITDTFTPEKQKDKNIYYLLPSQISGIPLNSYIFTLK